MRKDEAYYITTAIAYTNARPHLGYAYEAVLADVWARYWRARNADTFFLTGTDEHGTKIARKAAEEGLPPQAFADKYAADFEALCELLDISADTFIRTTDATRHRPGAEEMWRRLEAAGDIYKDFYVGWYCVGCEEFLRETDLVDGKCPSHDAAPERVEEENYFFRLSRYADRIKEVIADEEIVIMPASRKHEMQALLDAGVEDVSFSRPADSVSWGIPVPGDPDHVMYVWCDALSNYLSALGFGREDTTFLERYWPADVHVVGKDILRFHAIIWPGMLLSAGLALPRRILVHGFITAGGRKMSKSLGNVIDPRTFAERYGTDALRYYLTREILPTEDGDFTEERFVETYNANLANGIGNLTARVLKMADQYFDGTVARAQETDIPYGASLDKGADDEEDPFRGSAIPDIVTRHIEPRYHDAMERYASNEAIDIIWELIRTCDRYITEHEPFKEIKRDRERTQNMIWQLLYGLRAISGLLAPFLPDTATRIATTVREEEQDDGEVTYHATPLEAPLFARL